MLLPKEPALCMDGVLGYLEKLGADPSEPVSWHSRREREAEVPLGESSKPRHWYCASPPDPQAP